MLVCDRQPAEGRGLAHCGRRFGLYPVPTGQHASPSESLEKNSRLVGRIKKERDDKKGKGKESERRKG